MYNVRKNRKKRKQHVKIARNKSRYSSLVNHERKKAKTNSKSRFLLLRKKQKQIQSIKFSQRKEKTKRKIKKRRQIRSIKFLQRKEKTRRKIERKG